MDDLDLLHFVARLYYGAGLRQEAIAAELGVSRPTVSRYLSAAREAGLVEIIIRRPDELAAVATARGVALRGAGRRAG